MPLSVAGELLQRADDSNTGIAPIRGPAPGTPTMPTISAVATAAKKGDSNEDSSFINAVFVTPALAQAVIDNPGMCEQLYPNVNCEDYAPEIRTQAMEALRRTRTRKYQLRPTAHLTISDPRAALNIGQSDACCVTRARSERCSNSDDEIFLLCSAERRRGFRKHFQPKRRRFRR